MSGPLRPSPSPAVGAATAAQACAGSPGTPRAGHGEPADSWPPALSEPVLVSIRMHMHSHPAIHPLPLHPVGTLDTWRNKEAGRSDHSEYGDGQTGRQGKRRGGGGSMLTQTRKEPTPRLLCGRCWIRGSCWVPFAWRNPTHGGRQDRAHFRLFYARSPAPRVKIDTNGPVAIVPWHSLLAVW